MSAGMPSFSSVLKSREVEDPINLWFNRPLAYGFATLLHRTAITPNQVTLASLVVGLVAAALWLGDTRIMLAWGGVLLWLSAILDGADGILARAKQMTSELGRALDGTADMVVAVAAMLTAVVHLWHKHHDPWQLYIVPATVATSVLHIYLYDFYKEAYLDMLRGGWNGVAEQIPDVEHRLARLKLEGAPGTTILAAHLYRDLIRAQTWIVDRINPAARRQQRRFTVTPESAAIYRRHNRGPMVLWTWLSLAPHTYLLAICAMADRLDIYLWGRLVGANALFLVVLVWQRRSSEATLRDLQTIDAAPTDLAA